MPRQSKVPRVKNLSKLGSPSCRFQCTKYTKMLRNDRPTQSTANNYLNSFPCPLLGRVAFFYSTLKIPHRQCMCPPHAIGISPLYPSSGLVRRAWVEIATDRKRQPCSKRRCTLSAVDFPPIPSSDHTRCQLINQWIRLSPFHDAQILPPQEWQVCGCTRGVLR